MRFVKGLLFSGLLLLLIGCGEQLSANKISSGNTLDLQIQLGAAPTSGSYQYVVLYSKTSIRVPESGKYFFLPGVTRTGILPNNLPDTITSNEALINDYYAHYFSTFSHAFLLSTGGVVDNVFPHASNYFPVTVNASLYPEQFLVSAVSGVYAFSPQSNGLNLQIALDRIHNPAASGEMITGVFLTLDASGTILDQIEFGLSNQLGQTDQRNNNYSISGPANADIAKLTATLL